jgi:hypothetical protein
VIDSSINNNTSADIPYVEFTFTVFNGSFFTLLAESVTGYIEFNNRRFNSNGIEMITPLRGFRHGERRTLKIRHNLAPYEHELVSKTPGGDEAYFNLNYLDVMIIGDDILYPERIFLPEGIYRSGKILRRDH